MAAEFEKAVDAITHFGWPPSPYYAAENGQTKMLTQAQAKKYADAFGVRVEWLLYGEGERKKNVHAIVRIGTVSRNGLVNTGGLSKDEGPVREVRFVSAFSAAKVAFVTDGAKRVNGFKPGSLILCSDSVLNISSLLGKTAVVCLGNGELRLVDILEEPRKGKFTISFNDAVLEEAAVIRWALNVIGALMPGEWEEVERERLPQDFRLLPCDNSTLKTAAAS